MHLIIIIGRRHVQCVLSCDTSRMRRSAGLKRHAAASHNGKDPHHGRRMKGWSGGEGRQGETSTVVVTAQEPKKEKAEQKHRHAQKHTLVGSARRQNEGGNTKAGRCRPTHRPVGSARGRQRPRQPARARPRPSSSTAAVSRRRHSA